MTPITPPDHDDPTASAPPCPNCEGGSLKVFHSALQVPTNSCILLESRTAAVEYPRGDIGLGFCERCGFVGNSAFDKRLTEYSGRYEETQGFSPTFQRFHKDLAERLIQRFRLEDREILEIGCGKGEFLLLLCADGRNRGIGFDPAYLPDRHAPKAGERVTFVRDFYSEAYADTAADFVCCKMTLEHIPATLDFVRSVRATQGERRTEVFFMVPDATRILRDCAFEDVYYEHCSYFSPLSLERLFRAAGFFPTEVGTEYDGQYLTIAATTAPTAAADPASPLVDDSDVVQLGAWVARFPRRFASQVAYWKERLATLRAAGKRTAIWGSGSKGVAFLTTLALSEEDIACAVDINPNRQGFYMPGSGHRIVGPDDLVDLRPQAVILMNPIYRDEVASDLAKRGLTPELLSIDEGLDATSARA